MDKVFARNFVLFVIILLVCVGTLSYSLIKGDKNIEKTDELVLHTHSVITEAEKMASLVEGMLAAQRGYLLSGDENFLERYEAKKNDISNHIASLSELTSDNQSQQSRLNEIRTYFIEFSKRLEDRSQREMPSIPKTILKDVEAIDNVKQNIMRLNATLLGEEYELLGQRVDSVSKKKSQYFNALLIGIFVGTILLLIFNGFLLHAQQRRTKIEASLQDSEERFILAIEGTQDGIFDWDVKNNKVFYSNRFFSMLGYDRGAFTGTPEDFKELLHPDEVVRVWEHIEQYIAGGLSEYAQEFQMKHASGRWVWVQSRAKGLFDKEGNAYRIVGANTDITHLIKAQKKLEIEKKEAIDANLAKSEFLAHMSHEIRTPLNAINGVAEILEKNQKNLDERQQKLIRVLGSSTLSLKDLIDDVLDFSKIESGELELEEASFALDDMFEEIISMMSMRAAEKGISFVLDYNDIKGTGFYGDSKRLRQIIVNLITNAIKFTDQGGVTIKAAFEDRDDTSFLRVDVSDTGIGIEPENFDLVFERFKQADSSVSRKYGGTGLGLPISRSLARLMGGDIFLSSEAGKGSTFSMLISAHTIEKEDEKQPKREKINKLNDKIRMSLHNEHKILIVEDYDGNVVVLSYMLEELGIHYDVAVTGKEAVNQWKDNYYDIILMDIQMPEMDGFTATKTIRKLEKQGKIAHTPIIGMTAHALIGDKDKCIEAGMDAYLPKPIVEADLKKEILKYLKKEKKAA
jgi:PAS domain S-box-containing protein